MHLTTTMHFRFDYHGLMGLLNQKYGHDVIAKYNNYSTLASSGKDHFPFSNIVEFIEYMPAMSVFEGGRLTEWQNVSQPKLCSGTLTVPILEMRRWVNNNFIYEVNNFILQNYDSFDMDENDDLYDLNIERADTLEVSEEKTPDLFNYLYDVFVYFVNQFLCEVNSNGLLAKNPNFGVVDITIAGNSFYHSHVAENHIQQAMAGRSFVNNLDGYMAFDIELESFNPENGLQGSVIW